MRAAVTVSTRVSSGCGGRMVCQLLWVDAGWLMRWLAGRCVALGGQDQLSVLCEPQAILAAVVHDQKLAARPEQRFARYARRCLTYRGRSAGCWELGLDF